MHAEVLSVGTELLLGEITDTNAQEISARLKEAGIDVYRRVTVGDNMARLQASFSEALGRADVVIATGGLGPTDDDLTAEALAVAMGRKLVFDETAWSWTRSWFERRGRAPTESDRKQAMIIEGGMALRNFNGTAPGQAVVTDGKVAAILPGPPREMIPMLQDQVLPLISSQFPHLAPLHCRDLKLVGIGESRVGEVVRDLMRCSNPTLAPYAGSGEVRLRIAAKSQSPKEATAMLDRVEAEVRSRLQEYVYGTGDATLESVCGDLLAKKGLTLAIAESVTGGLIAHRVTLVPGSSRYFRMGVVAYDPAVKVTCLGVSGEAVRKNDAVSADVARDMALGVKTLAGAKIGLATTGFAGPDGGTPDEPVGTVYTAVASADGVTVDRQVYGGSRAAVKQYASQRALYMLWTTVRGLR
ncbi:MAG: competence/damage-inducible protein A [Bacillota bacterium]